MTVELSPEHAARYFGIDAIDRALAILDVTDDEFFDLGMNEESDMCEIIQRLHTLRTKLKEAMEKEESA